MKFLGKLKLAGLLTAAVLPPLAGAVEVDGVVAAVGDELILRSEVEGEMRREGVGESEFAAFRNRLIERKLIIRAAREQKLSIQEWLVDNRVREIVETAFGGDQNRLKAALAAQKVQMAEWRERIKSDMIVGAMRWNMVDKYAAASPAEMKAEYRAHPERYLARASTTVAVILLKPEDAAKKSEVEAALKTESFADVARRFSADSHAAQGGVWKEIDPEKTFRPEVAAAIAALTAGQTSGWVDIGGWSFLIRKMSETAERQSTFAEAYDRIEANVKRENARKLYDEWIERLKAANYIRVY